MLGIYYEVQRESPEVIYGMKDKHGEGYEKDDEDTPFRQ